MQKRTKRCKRAYPELNDSHVKLVISVDSPPPKPGSHSWPTRRARRSNENPLLMPKVSLKSYNYSNTREFAAIARPLARLSRQDVVLVSASVFVHLSVVSAARSSGHHPPLKRCLFMVLFVGQVRRRRRQRFRRTLRHGICGRGVTYQQQVPGNGEVRLMTGLEAKEGATYRDDRRFRKGKN